MTSSASGLIDRLSVKQAVIGIVGLGYVGLPLLVRYAEAGFRVLGFDVDPNKVNSLNRGESYIAHIPSTAIKAAVADGTRATVDFGQIPECDAIILCLPTPLNRHREPDLSFVTDTVEAIAPYMTQGQALSLESTTWPGTTDEEVLTRVAREDFVVGRDFFLIYSPEREDPGNPQFSTRTIPKVVGGVTSACLEVGQALYGGVIDEIVPVSSTRAAEMTKLLENIHRAVNIGLVNELKIVADRMGIDIHEVIDAAATKPFGFTPYYPGPGLGGHCIPIDPFYLTWKAREFGIATRFIELAGEVNTNMPRWVVEKVSAALNERGRAVKGARILVLGVAYKKNVDDMRESPSLEIMELLVERGAEVSYCDPHVPVFPKLRKFHFDFASVDLTPEGLAGYDCVLLSTDHTGFDYEMIAANARLVVDTRGVYRRAASNIVKA